MISGVHGWTEIEIKAAIYDELIKLEASKENIKVLQDELIRRNDEANKLKGCS